MGMSARLSFQDFGRRMMPASAANSTIMPMLTGAAGAWPDGKQCSCSLVHRPDVVQAIGARLTLSADGITNPAAPDADLHAAQVALQERRLIERQQEVLIAELNHRMRNVLGLVCSIISQSRLGATSVDDFAEVIGQRVQALGRAHDLITAGSTSPSTLRGLVITEAKAYLGDHAGRVRISGPDSQLTPAAVTTVALVIHELMTNSVKYGAMSSVAGELLIGFARSRDGELELSWEERGGPAITAPPARRGFGTTLIEGSIPHDLGGTCAIDFAPGGLQVKMTVPARHVTRFLDAAEEASSQASVTSEVPLTGPVLLVEDNMLIALDAEEMLRKLGASEVRLAGSVIEAQGLLDAGGIAFAVLDFSLGGETTETLGRTLQAQGIPFLFATGYGDSSTLAADFPAVEIVLKPYETTVLQTAIDRTLARSVP